MVVGLGFSETHERQFKGMPYDNFSCTRSKHPLQIFPNTTSSHPPPVLNLGLALGKSVKHIPIPYTSVLFLCGTFYCWSWWEISFTCWHCPLKISNSFTAIFLNTPPPPISGHQQPYRRIEETEAQKYWDMSGVPRPPRIRSRGSLCPQLMPDFSDVCGDHVTMLASETILYRL